MNYVILKNFLSVKDCNSLIALTEVKHPSEVLLYDNAFSNIWIDSTQSKGLRYRYQNDFTSLSLSRGIIKELKAITGIEFENNLQDSCLSINHYGHKAYANLHRDRDKSIKEKEGVKYQKYLVVMLLTEPGIDTCLPVDELYLRLPNDSNDTLVTLGAAVYDNGKIVKRLDNGLDDFFPNLKKGDAIIFRNNNSAHGVLPVMVKEGQRGRMTIGFRSK